MNEADALVAYHESRGGCDAPEAGPSDTAEALVFRAQCQISSVQRAYAKYEEVNAELYGALVMHHQQLLRGVADLAIVRAGMEALMNKLMGTLDEAMKAVREL